MCIQRTWTHVGPVLAASISESSHDPRLGDSPSRKTFDPQPVLSARYARAMAAQNLWKGSNQLMSDLT